MSNIKKLELLNIIFLSCIVIGFFKNGDEVVKYIGIIGSVIVYIIRLFVDKLIIKVYKSHFMQNKTLFISLILFLISILISILCAYDNPIYSLLEFKEEFLYVSIFVIISLSIDDKILLSKSFLYAILLVFVFDIIIYAVKYIKHNHNLNLSIRLERKMSDYAEILFPFVFASFFILHNNKIKYFLGILLLLGFVELFLTGARGAWISVISEVLIFFSMILFIYKGRFKYFIKIIIVFVFIVFLSVYYLYNNSNLVKRKINQGLNTSGRNVIIDTRLPIFLKHENILWGIGGPGNYQYIKFLNDYRAVRVYGSQYKNYFQYWADEPFLLQIFYKEGVFGLISFLFLSGVFIWKSLNFIKRNKDINRKLFITSILTSYIGYYFVRGLVEGRNLKYFLIFLILYLITKEENNENSISVS